jgi:hypothetical protein
VNLMKKSDDDEKVDSIEQLEDESSNIIMEFLDFLKENKKFWLIPIILVLLLLGLLLFASPAAAPFIYALF